MIERHVALTLLEGKEVGFEEFLDQEYLPAMSKQRGFQGASLIQELEPPGKFTLVIRFDDLEAAANWRASQIHRNLSPDFKSFYSSSEVKVFNVRITKPK
jgi:heme-degrading monooxygenase HmoA